MAIIGTMNTEYGISCSYHNIREWREHEKELEFAIYSYVDKEAKEVNKRPIVMTRVVLPKWEDVTVLDEEGMNHLKYCYSKLMEEEEERLLIENYITFDGEIVNDEEDVEEEEE